MASTVIKKNPVLSNFISLSHEQILKMGPEEVTVLKIAGDELYQPSTPFANNEAFTNFSAAVHNSIPFFETACAAFARIIEHQKRLSTSKGFEKHSVRLQICADYKKAQEDYTSLLKVAHYFLLLAHNSLIRSLREF